MKSNFCFLLFILFTSCAVNPVTGKKELSFMSEKQEIALGQQSDPQIIASMGLYEDDQLQQFITSRGLEMAKISHRPNLPYEFKVVDSPVVNAFAVPGGFIYFTRGIMAHFNNEAEFAGVLGHEIGHVTARHSAKQQTKATLAQLGFVVGVVVSKDFRNFAQEAQQGLGLLLLKYGRDMETQSDELGVQYSTEVGYDSHHMANFFKTLSRMRPEGSEQIPTFMSTHPDPANRFQNVNAMSDEIQKDIPNKNLKVNRDSYLRMIDGLTYGEDPKQGYVDGNTFYHPVLKFQFPVPGGWQVANSPQQVQMAPQDGKSLMVFTLAPQQTLEAAASASLEENGLTLVEKKNLTVNGLPAIGMVADQIPTAEQTQQGAKALRVMSYFISYNNLIYVFHGLSTKEDFTGYVNVFKGTMAQFKPLTDPAKINVEADRIRIVNVSKAMTLQQALNGYSMPSNRHEEIAILNSMELNQTLPANTLIKIIAKGGT
jgi:predicted Zn-dependent protease